MNRRELLKSAAVIVGAPVSVFATEQIVNHTIPKTIFKTGQPVLFHHWRRPLIVVQTKKRMSAIQLAQTRQKLDAEGERHGCQIVFVCDCDSVVMSGGNDAKYGFTHKTGDSSLSVYCQTADELREWMPAINGTK